jgi:hypothetical protein
MQSNNNIKQVIQNWYTYKKQSDELEKKIEKCREIVKEYMEDNDINIIVSDNHIVKRSKHTREVLNRKDIPEDILKKYQKQNEYWLFKVTEK